MSVTNDLVRRLIEHKTSAIKGHTDRHRIKRLVYFEIHDDVKNALQREKNIKHWPRAWKVNLMARENPA